MTNIASLRYEPTPVGSLPVIETERLVLRVPVQADFDGGWAAAHGDEAFGRHLGGPMPQSVAWRFMATVIGMWQLRGHGMFSVVEKESGRWIGRIGPWVPQHWPEREVGWALAPSAWGKGYATEAARACMDFAFDTLGWPSAAHMIHPDNVGSQAVARRLGSRILRHETLPPPLDVRGPIEIWGQSADEWRSSATRRAGKSP